MTHRPIACSALTYLRTNNSPVSRALRLSANVLTGMIHFTADRERQPTGFRRAWLQQIEEILAYPSLLLNSQVDRLSSRSLSGGQEPTAARE